MAKEVQITISPDLSTNQNFCFEARHMGTAAWFLSKALTEWKASGVPLVDSWKTYVSRTTDEHSESGLLDLKAGAGKSTLLYVMPDEFVRGCSMPTGSAI